MQRGKYVRTEETKRKSRESQLGVTSWNKGKPWSDEEKEKRRKAALGKTQSLATRLKRSESLKGLRKGVKLTQSHKDKIGLGVIRARNRE